MSTNKPPRIIVPLDYPEPEFNVDNGGDEVILVDKFEFYTDVRLKSSGRVKRRVVTKIQVDIPQYREKHGAYIYWVEFKSGKSEYFYEKQLRLKNGK